MAKAGGVGAHRQCLQTFWENFNKLLDTPKNIPSLAASPVKEEPTV